jgi:phytoene dehydrogenase-like protein
MFVPPPPQGPFWSLLDQSPQGQDLMQAMQKSMLEIVDELFESEKVKLHLLKFAAELLVAPEEKGTGGTLYYMPGYLHTYGIGIPVGGSSALSSALIKALTAHGATLRKDALVEKVLTEGGSAVGVRLRDGETIRTRMCVIGQIHPWLLPDIIDGLDERVARNAKRTKTANFTVMVGHYALNEAPNYLSGNEPRNCTLTSFAPSSLHTYRRAFDEYRYGELPDVPIFSAHMMSQFDPSRAPPGKHTVTIWRFAPFALRNGGAAAWESRKNFDDEQTLAHLQYFAPNVGGANIVGRALDTPYDMLLHTPTFQNGDVGGIGKFFHQIGGHRPTPELSQYAVPGVERFYLTGTFMHPPGGITGGGRVTAMKICGDLGIDFDHLTR